VIIQVGVKVTGLEINAGINVLFYNNQKFRGNPKLMQSLEAFEDKIV
jgi:hypothetical protein